MSPCLEQKRSFTHLGQVPYTALQMVSSFSSLELAKDNAAGDRCNHCFWVSRAITDGSWLFLHFRCFTLITFFLPFRSSFFNKWSSASPSRPYPPNSWRPIRWLVMWKLSLWSVLPNYLLMSPAYLYKSLLFCLHGRLYSRDYFACIHGIACASLTAVRTCEPCSVTQAPAHSLLTQINSATQLPLSCTLALGTYDLS